MTVPPRSRQQPPAQVLVVDDDAGLRRTLGLNLRAHGYDVRLAGEGREALRLVAEQAPDLVILDLGLPDVDGMHVLTRLRALDAGPVLVLSARHDTRDKVEALDLGADDYVTKPFSMAELLARVRRALRQIPEPAAPPEPVVTDTLRLDLAHRSAWREGEPVHLTPTEWRIVEELAGHPGELVRHQDLLRAVWGPAYGSETHYLRVYLAQLRRKLEADPRAPRHFVTEPGVGHRFVP